jgi:hypothetical protein
VVAGLSARASAVLRADFLRALCAACSALAGKGREVDAAIKADVEAAGGFMGRV